MQCDFFDRLECLMKERGVSHLECATAMDISLNTFRNQIYTHVIPKADAACKLARFLDTTVEYLVFGESAKQNQIGECKNLLSNLEQDVQRLKKVILFHEEHQL